MCTSPEEVFINLWGHFESLWDFLCSHSDGGGIQLMAVKDAKLSAMHGAFPHHGDLSCDSFEYLLSNQTFMYIKNTCL